MMKEPEHRKLYPIPIYAAAESLSRGRVIGAKRYLTRGFPKGFADSIISNNGRFTKRGVLWAIDYPLDRRFKDAMTNAFYSQDCIQGLKKSEERLLEALQLTDDNGTLTQVGKNRVIECLPLAAQCEALRLNLSTHTISRGFRRVEDGAADFLKNFGEKATTCEVGPFDAINTCIVIACLRRLAVRDKSFSRLLKRRFGLGSYFSPAPIIECEGHKIKMDWHDEKKLAREFLNTSHTITSDDVESCLNNEFIGSITEQEYPALEKGHIVNLFCSLSRFQIKAIASLFLKAPSQNRVGWPDLALFDNSKVRLIEVKTTDRLHYSQIHTIPLLQQIFDDVSVAKIHRVKPDSVVVKTKQNAETVNHALFSNQTNPEKSSDRTDYVTPDHLS